jgi:hypothetical protein
MPVRLTRSRETGAVFWHQTCEEPGCTAPAPFGFDCYPTKGLALILAGKREEGYRRLGRWYCGAHRPNRPAPAPAQEALF